MLSKNIQTYFPVLLLVLVAIIYPPREFFKLHTDDFLVKAHVTQNYPEFLVLNNKAENTAEDSFNNVADAFYFFGPTQQATERLKEYGALPWWSDDDALMAMFRPISAITHYIDHVVLKSNFLFIQLHSLLWFLIFSLCAYLFYKQFSLPKPVLLLACLIFVIDLNHMGNFYWLSARNGYIAPIFALLAFVLHVRWRETGRLLFLFFALALFSLGLLSAEAGVAIGAYLLSYAIFIDKEKLIPAVLSIFPYGIVLLAWRFAYQSMGYGAKHIGLYVDPLYSPIEFIQSLLKNVLNILATVIMGVGDFFPSMSEGVHAQFLVFSFLLIVVSTLLILPLLKAHKEVRFFYFAFFISVIPFCALSTYTSRSGVFAYLGFSGLLASLIYYYFKADQYRFLKYSFIAFALLCHLLVPAGLSIYTSIAPPKENTVDTNRDLEHGYPSISSHYTVYLNYPSEVNAMFMPYTWHVENTPLPNGIFRLVPGLNSFTVQKVDERTFLLTSDLHFALNKKADLSTVNESPKSGLLYALRMAHGFTSNRENFSQGQEFVHQYYSVQVLKLDKGLPSELLFKFSENISMDELEWRLWNWNTFSFDEFRFNEEGRARVLNQWDAFEQ